MVDVNPGRSALQAQLQASAAKGKISSRPLPPTNRVTPTNNKPSFNPQDVIGKRIAARTDIPSADRRVPVKVNSSAGNLSSADDIDEASLRVANFTGSSREAPTGRLSNESLIRRDQPLGQIINILV